MRTVAASSGRAPPTPCAARPSICFVAHNAYGALAGVDTGHAGGIERQQTLMARWLAQRGYRVSMVTWDEGQTDGATTGGVRVHKMCPRAAGLRLLRFIHPRWTSLRRALRRADADIYYYNCGDLGLGQVAQWTRAHGRKCVYSVASEPDCDPRLPVLRQRRERVLYRYGLRRADRVIVQTSRQQRMLETGFGVKAVLIPMPCEDQGGPSERRARPPDGQPVRVLWVGRFSPEKRLQWLLKLARRRPQWAFDVVGAANPDADATSIDRRGVPVNVVLHGRVAHQRMAAFYRRAAALCCTSAYEGFPNTFLEAWSVGLPVVSTFDPDDVIATRGCGVVARTVEQLEAGLAALVNSPARWWGVSEAGRRYFLENHTLEASMVRFEAVFHELVATVPVGARAAPGEPRGGAA